MLNTMAELVDKNTLIGDIVKEHPGVVSIMNDHGIHCVGCHVATWETLGQASRDNNVDADGLLRELNEYIKEEGG